MIPKNKKLLIAANWKMTPPTLPEAKKNAVAFKNISKKYVKAPKSKVSLQVLVCPPFPYIAEINSVFKNSPACVGAQDVSRFDGGSKTGEVPSTALQSMGVSHVIVGHSERRAMGDTDDIVSIKLGQVIRMKTQAILCIGEDKRDDEAQYLEVIKAQMKASLAQMNNADFSKLIIAYEPVWAIGRTDNVALSGHDLHQMVIYIRKVLRDLYNDSIATSTKILYGGSVTPENAEEIIWNGEVDGLLIGRASFDPKTYEAICKAIALPTHSSMITRETAMKTMKNIKIGKAISGSGKIRPAVKIKKKKPAKTKKSVKKNSSSNKGNAKGKNKGSKKTSKRK